MDTSEQFIKMADCPEIQKGKPSGGTEISCYIDVFIHTSKYGDYWALGKRLIWLPRQDDIQKMLIKEKFGDFNAHWDMCIDIPVQFVAKNPTLELSSMEQIWLGCYMLSIHQKIWSSKEEKWVKK